MYHAWQLDQASIIEVNNDLDMFSSPVLVAAIDVAAKSDRAIIVSLEQCSFCDSTGLGVLADAKKRFGTKLLVVVPQKKRKVFDITGLTAYLAVSETLKEALIISSAAVKS